MNSSALVAFWLHLSWEGEPRAGCLAPCSKKPSSHGDSTMSLGRLLHWMIVLTVKTFLCWDFCQLLHFLINPFGVAADALMGLLPQGRPKPQPHGGQGQGWGQQQPPTWGRARWAGRSCVSRASLDLLAGSCLCFHRGGLQGVIQ